MTDCKRCGLPDTEGILCKHCAKEISKQDNPVDRDLNRRGTDEKGRSMRYVRPLPEQEKP